MWRTLQNLAVPVYTPIFLGSVGGSMLVPVLPLYLDDLNLSLAAISLVLAGIGMGAAVGGLPAGGVIARYGERAAMIGALVALVASTAPLGFTRTALVLLALQVVMGLANVLLRLSRQTFVTRRVPAARRGRALSLVGGSFRLAFLVGPLLGGFLVDLVGFRWTFLVAATFGLVSLLAAMFVTVDALPLLPEAEDGNGREGLIAGLVSQRHRLVRAGWVPMLVMAVRSGRFVVLPLIADALGASATEVGLVVTVSTLTDLLLFPAAGLIMDRFGRLSAMVPAFGIITAGLVWLGVANTPVEVVLAGSIIGVGNGLSAGAMLTLGSDLAPPDSPGPFLAGMAAVQSLGRVVGPLLVGAVWAVAGLGAAAMALAATMVVAIGVLVFVIGESSDRARVRSPQLR